MSLWSYNLRTNPFRVGISKLAWAPTVKVEPGARLRQSRLVLFMGDVKMKIRLISDPETTAVLAKAAREAKVEAGEAELKSLDNRFGLAEVSAIFAIAQTSVQLGALIYSGWKARQKRTKVILQSPHGSLTIEGSEDLKLDEVIERINQAGLFK